jgi:hypothetical protein
LSCEERKDETSSPETFEALDETVQEFTKRGVHDRRTDEIGRFMRRVVGLRVVLVVCSLSGLVSGDGVLRVLGVCFLHRRLLSDDGGRDQMAETPS